MSICAYKRINIIRLYKLVVLSAAGGENHINKGWYFEKTIFSTGCIILMRLYGRAFYLNELS